MTSDRLDRITLKLWHLEQGGLDPDLVEVLELLADEIRYLRNRPLTQQVIDSGQELLKEQN